MLIIILFVFAFTAYATSEHLGSPGAVYDLLVAASKRHPVEGNAGGSYLTMNSKEGGIFFVINIVGNFGTASLEYDKHLKHELTSGLGVLRQWLLQ